MALELIIAGIVAVYAAAMYALRRSYGPAIGGHPYRDPYGDAPAAWRSASSDRDKYESIRRAPGTR
jgi:hypothetical protein